jgi:hypothetical protein
VGVVKKQAGELEALREELRFFKLELANRENNFNRMFNRGPVVLPPAAGSGGGVATARLSAAALTAGGTTTARAAPTALPAIPLPATNRPLPRPTPAATPAGGVPPLQLKQPPPQASSSTLAQAAAASLASQLPLPLTPSTARTRVSSDGSSVSVRES